MYAEGPEVLVPFTSPVLKTSQQNNVSLGEKMMRLEGFWPIFIIMEIVGENPGYLL